MHMVAKGRFGDGRELPKRRRITKVQRGAIKSYIEKGYSSNKIQRLLSERRIGMRRKTLLKEIRRIKGVGKKTHARKYTPKKYVRKIRWKETAIGKKIAVYGTAHTKKYVRGYSARFEFSGSGKSLYRIVGYVKEGFVPHKENPFVKCSVGAFSRNPDLYGEEGWWTCAKAES